MTLLNLILFFRQLLYVVIYNTCIFTIDVYFFIKNKLRNPKTDLELEYQATYFYSKYNLSEYKVQLDDNVYEIYFFEFEKEKELSTTVTTDTDTTDNGSSINSEGSKVSYHQYDFLTFQETQNEMITKDLLEKRNYILYCGIVCDAENRYVDCTEYLRKFCFYFSNDNQDLTWKMILSHIALIENINLKSENFKIVLYKNDNELTEIEMDINKQLLNTQFCVK